MKKFRIPLAIMLVVALVVTVAIIKKPDSEAASAAVTITESAGYLESAYVEWGQVSGASAYNVYVKSASASDYTKLDTTLVRQYSSYFRADAVGLAAGKYVLKVVPVISGSESSAKAATTSALTVTAHTREGFAFSSSSDAKTASGGYNDNGTVPSNAQIVYVTADTVNKVTLDVITSSSGKITSCTGLGAIMAARQKGYDTTPLIIRVVGEIKSSDIDGLNGSGYLQVKTCKNITIEGIGEDATINGWGLLVRNATNIEIRNLGVMLFPDDGISLDTGNRNIWIHNNDIFYGTAGGDADQAKGDGSADCKKDSSYVTMSYNHFWDSGKCSLCGLSESTEFFVTYHHNWFDHSDSRHPRIRTGTIHIYNNYFDGNAKYGVGATSGCSAFVEANYFRNCKYPMLISLQGTDVYGTNENTFSGEEGGMIKAYNNTIIGANRFVDQSYSATDFDAVTVTSRNATVSSSYKTTDGGNTYNNFDTSSSMYSYTPDSPSNVVSVVEKYAGRMNGGDFKWDFNDASEDTSYSINSSLMSAIRAYKSSVVAIGVSVGSQDLVETTKAATTAPATTKAATTAPATTEPATTAPATTEPASTDATVHNFTTDGKTSSFFSITGNLSKSKGSVSYNGLTLTQCLKIESSTKITFKTTAKATLTLVLNSSNSKNIKVDGTTYTIDSKGIATVSLAAGSHTIAKANSGNLYYIGLAY